MPLKFQPEKQP